MSDSLFEIDTVRDFISTHGCKVTNHQLVTHFKRFLNDPVHKVANREKFKDYVNTLAIVKLDESGEKVLVLKKKYRDSSCHEESRDESCASSITSQGSANPSVPGTVLPPDPALPSTDDPHPPHHHTDDPALPAHSDEQDKENIPQHTPVQVELVLGPEVGDSTTDEHPHPPAALRLGSPVGESCTDSPTPPLPQSPEHPALQEVPPEDQVQETTLKNDGMSVKERARHLNKIQSQTDLNATKSSPKNKGNKTEDDSTSVSSVGLSLDPAEREWMITCPSADYHPMAKLLSANPQLAKKKDFITGFTALHWAAKHGKAEVIKLLCGTPGIIVNARSHGGYTALHLAAMHGHEHIIELLIQVYGADANIRDHSGKKAKQYLRNSASTRAQQLLQARRISTAMGASAPFKRVGSYSSKIRSTGFFGISSGSAVRNSWTGGSDVSSDKSPSPSPRPSPSPSPRQSPKNVRKNSAQLQDVHMMPPPKVAPPRRKKSRSGKEYSHKERPSSDSEMGVHHGSEQDLTASIPHSRSSVFI